MPFGRISDDLCTNRKVLRLLSLRGGREALGLWTMADSWCNSELTDGHVPSYIVTGWGWKLACAERLVEAGLWHRAEGGFVFHDWTDFNDSRKVVLEKRVADAVRKKNVRLEERSKNALLRDASGVDSAESPEKSTTESSAPTSTSTSFPSSLRSEGGGAGLGRTLDLLPHEPLPEPKPAKPRDEAKLLWAATLKAEAEALGIPRPEVGGKIRDAVIRMARERAAQTGESFASVLRAWVAGGLKVHVETGKEAHWALKDWRPYQARAAPPGRPGRREQARATTGADFEDAEDIETQMRKQGL